MNQLPNCLLKYLLLFCHESYNTLRVVNHLFAKIIPMPRVKQENWKIMQPLKITVKDWFTIPDYVRDVKGFMEENDTLDVSHLNLHEISIIGNNSNKLIVPRSIKLLNCEMIRCNLSNTQLEDLTCFNLNTCITAPITLKKLHARFFPHGSKFPNLEELQCIFIGTDLSHFTLLKKIDLSFSQIYKLPNSITEIHARNVWIDQDFRNLPNLKLVVIYGSGNVMANCTIIRY